MDTTRPDLLNRVKKYLAETIHQIDPATQMELQAWEEFFDLYNGILTRFGGKLCFREEEIDDLLQEVWADVVRLLPRFEYDREKGSFRRWLYRIIRSKAADIGRRRQRQPAAALPDSGPLNMDEVPSQSSDGPVETVHRNFLIEVVNLAIERYRLQAEEKDWDIFERCKMHGQTSSQVAQELGITPEAARKRLQRSLAQFRDILTQIVGRIDPEDDLA